MTVFLLKNKWSPRHISAWNRNNTKKNVTGILKEPNLHLSMTKNFAISRKTEAFWVLLQCNPHAAVTLASLYQISSVCQPESKWRGCLVSGTMKQIFARILKDLKPKEPRPNTWSDSLETVTWGRPSNKVVLSTSSFVLQIDTIGLIPCLHKNQVQYQESKMWNWKHRFP